MAGKFITPGVYFEENDQSFYQPGTTDIGAVIIGPTEKGEAFIPTKVATVGEFNLKFGYSNGTSYVPQTVIEYLKNAGTATIVRTLGINGYAHDGVVNLIATGSFGKKCVATFHRSNALTALDATDTLGDSTILYVTGSDTFTLDLIPTINSGSTTSYAASVNSTDSNYIGKLIATNPKTTDVGYAMTFFDKSLQAYYDTDENIQLILDIADLDYTYEYQRAETPWITSQKIGAITYNLFKLHTKSTGVYANNEIKVSIENVKLANEVSGSDYGTFDIYVRKIGDNDRQRQLLESFVGLSLDPESANYIARKIGDKIPTYSSGKIINIGEYDNLSNYIIVEVVDEVKNKSISPTLIPWGHKALYQPTIVGAGITLPTASFVTTQEYSSQYNNKICYGFNYDITTDNLQYLKPLPETAVSGLNADFNLDNYTIHANAPQDAGLAIIAGTLLSARKFVVPFQGGFDGEDPATVKNMGGNITATNSMGYNFSTPTSNGSVIYERIATLLGNAFKYDFNLVFTPGVLYGLHPFVATKFIELCENRGDAFYIMDSFNLTDTVQQAVSTVDGLDTSYACTAYPWVKILDKDRNLYTNFPPSVALAGAFSYNDAFGAQWYAPAGLNRGALTSVTDAYTPLNAEDLGTLYESRINPIVQFSEVGYTLWGQKTLQVRSSSLDRINVRRLLINVKKFLAQVAKYVVFEPNTRVYRSKLEKQINPYLENIREKNGLYAFKVVIDETNNTSDVIDRNAMAGTIYLRPTKSSETIEFQINILGGSGLEIEEQ